MKAQKKKFTKYQSRSSSKTKSPLLPVDLNIHSLMMVQAKFTVVVKIMLANLVYQKMSNQQAKSQKLTCKMLTVFLQDPKTHFA